MLLLLFFLIQSCSSLKVLWIGNSYTYVNDVPATVGRLAEAAGEELVFDSHTEGGWTWELHSTSQETLNKIKSKKWDVVILQEFSVRPAYDTDRVCRNTVTYLDILADKIRENNPDTIIQFYLTWGRPFGYDKDCPSYPQLCNYHDMQDALTESYTNFACMKKPARVAPVGEAFRLIRQSQGQDMFHSLYNTNGVSDHHASERGSYLSALVHFISLFERGVVGNTETAGLPADIVAILQDAAEATVASQNWEYPADQTCSLTYTCP